MRKNKRENEKIKKRTHIKRERERDIKTDRQRDRQTESKAAEIYREEKQINKTGKM